MPTAKVCTICDTEPALGVGVGKMKSTCAGCIASLIGEGTCPACRGVETYTTEHIAVCDGKLPKKPKGTHKGGTRSASNGTKTGHQMGVEAAANKQSETRRAARMLTVEEATALVADLEGQIKRAPDDGLTEKQVIALNKKLTDAKAKLTAAEKVPTNRCDECNCFLSDRGKCVNEECVLVKA